MKYLKALEERQLNIADLQKAVQKKIVEIENLSNKVNQLREIEDLDEEDKSTLSDAEIALSSLDDYLTRKIQIFNPEIYAKKLEVMKNAQSKRTNLSADKVEVKEMEQYQDYEQEQDKEQEQQPHPKQEQQKEHQYEPQEQYEQDNDEYYYEEEEEQAKVVEMPKKAILQKKLNNLKQSLTVRDEHFEDGGEIDEFAKVENVKPKKLTTPLIIMGIGALILTVGAVNFFKRR